MASVSTSPSTTAVALMPLFLNSVLMNWVKLITPAFAAPYIMPPTSPGVTPASEETFMMVPCLASSIVGTTACVQNTVPTRFESITRRISSGGVVKSLL